MGLENSVVAFLLCGTFKLELCVEQCSLCAMCLGCCCEWWFSTMYCQGGCYVFPAVCIAVRTL